MTESAVQQTNRRSRRSNVLLKATLEAPGGSLEVVLRNLSQDGALIQCDDVPEQGTRVLFHRQGLSVPGRIAWSHAGLAGLEFDFPLYPKEVLRHIPSGERKAPLPSARRPGLAAQPLTSAERTLIEQWATQSSNMLGE